VADQNSSAAKFLLLTHGMPPPFRGGSGRYLYNIFTRLPDIDITIFTEVSRAKEPPTALDSVRFIRRRYIFPYSNPAHPSLVRKLAKLRMMILWALDLIGLCVRSRPDCIFVGQARDAGPSAMLAKWLFGIPYIVFVYGEELTKAQRLPLRAQIIRMVCRQANKVITISDFTMEELVMQGIDREHIALVTPGTDCEQFTPNLDATDLRAELAPDDHMILLTIGRLTKRKGHAQVISVLPRILKHVPKLLYVIVGTDVGEGPRLHQLVVDLEIEKHVHFTGHVEEEDIPKFLNACDVFIMANYEIEETRDTEGFGIVFLEANACGKPVIGGRTGGVQSAVVDGETGLLVNATNKDELTNAILELFTNRKLAHRLGQLGRKRVVTQFSWESKAIAVQKIAEDIIANK